MPVDSATETWEKFKNTGSNLETLACTLELVPYTWMDGPAYPWTNGPMFLYRMAPYSFM